MYTWLLKEISSACMDARTKGPCHRLPTQVIINVGRHQSRVKEEDRKLYKQRSEISIAQIHESVINYNCYGTVSIFLRISNVDENIILHLVACLLDTGARQGPILKDLLPTDSLSKISEEVQPSHSYA